MKCLIDVEYACESCGQVDDGQLQVEWSGSATGGERLRSHNLKVVAEGLPRGWRLRIGGGARDGGVLLCVDCLSGKPKGDVHV